MTVYTLPIFNMYIRATFTRCVHNERHSDGQLYRLETATDLYVELLASEVVVDVYPKRVHLCPRQKKDASEAATEENRKIQQATSTLDTLYTDSVAKCRRPTTPLGDSSGIKHKEKKLTKNMQSKFCFA